MAGPSVRPIESEDDCRALKFIHASLLKGVSAEGWGPETHSALAVLHCCKQLFFCAKDGVTGCDAVAAARGALSELQHFEREIRLGECLQTGQEPIALQLHASGEVLVVVSRSAVSLLRVGDCRGNSEQVAGSRPLCLLNDARLIAEFRLEDEDEHEEIAQAALTSDGQRLLLCTRSGAALWGCISEGRLHRLDLLSNISVVTTGRKIGDGESGEGVLGYAASRSAPFRVWQISLRGQGSPRAEQLEFEFGDGPLVKECTALALGHGFCVGISWINDWLDGGTVASLPFLALCIALTDEEIASSSPCEASPPSPVSLEYPNSLVLFARPRAETAAASERRVKLEVFSGALNELLFNQVDEQSRVHFLPIPAWGCLCVRSSCSAEASFFACEGLVAKGEDGRRMHWSVSSEETPEEDDSWLSFLMPEGRVLGVAGSDGVSPRGLSIFVGFDDFVPRPEANADTPLLEAPPVFFLAESDGVISVHFADTWEYAVRKTGVEQHRLLPELPQLLPQQDNFAARLEALVALGSEAFPRETETHCEACEEGSAVEESPLQDEATEDTASLRRTAAAASRPPGLPHALKLLALRGKREAARAQPFGSSHSLLSPTAAEGKLAAEVCFLRLRGGAREEDCSGARMLRRWRRKMLCTTEQKDALSLLKQAWRGEPFSVAVEALPDSLWNPLMRSFRIFERSLEASETSQLNELRAAREEIGQALSVPTGADGASRISSPIGERFLRDLRGCIAELEGSVQSLTEGQETLEADARGLGPCQREWLESERRLSLASKALLLQQSFVASSQRLSRAVTDLSGLVQRSLLSRETEPTRAEVALSSEELFASVEEKLCELEASLARQSGVWVQLLQTTSLPSLDEGAAEQARRLQSLNAEAALIQRRLRSLFQKFKALSTRTLRRESWPSETGLTKGGSETSPAVRPQEHVSQMRGDEEALEKACRKGSKFGLRIEDFWEETPMTDGSAKRLPPAFEGKEIVSATKHFPPCKTSSLKAFGARPLAASLFDEPFNFEDERSSAFSLKVGAEAAPPSACNVKETKPAVSLSSSESGNEIEALFARLNAALAESRALQVSLSALEWTSVSEIARCQDLTSVLLNSQLLAEAGGFADRSAAVLECEVSRETTAFRLNAAPDASAFRENSGLHRQRTSQQPSLEEALFREDHRRLAARRRGRRALLAKLLGETGDEASEETSAQNSETSQSRLDSPAFPGRSQRQAKKASLKAHWQISSSEESEPSVNDDAFSDSEEDCRAEAVGRGGSEDFDFCGLHAARRKKFAAIKRRGRQLLLGAKICMEIKKALLERRKEETQRPPVAAEREREGVTRGTQVDEADLKEATQGREDVFQTQEEEAPSSAAHADIDASSAKSGTWRFSKSDSSDLDSSPSSSPSPRASAATSPKTKSGFFAALPPDPFSVPSSPSSPSKKQGADEFQEETALFSKLGDAPPSPVESRASSPSQKNFPTSTRRSPSPRSEKGSPTNGEEEQPTKEEMAKGKGLDCVGASEGGDDSRAAVSETAGGAAGFSSEKQSASEAEGASLQASFTEEGKREEMRSAPCDSSSAGQSSGPTNGFLAEKEGKTSAGVEEETPFPKAPHSCVAALPSDSAFASREESCEMSCSSEAQPPQPQQSPPRAGGDQRGGFFGRISEEEQNVSQVDIAEIGNALAAAPVGRASGFAGSVYSSGPFGGAGENSRPSACQGGGSGLMGILGEDPQTNSAPRNAEAEGFAGAFSLGLDANAGGVQQTAPQPSFGGNASGGGGSWFGGSVQSQQMPEQRVSFAGVEVGDLSAAPRRQTYSFGISEGASSSGLADVRLGDDSDRLSAASIQQQSVFASFASEGGGGFAALAAPSGGGFFGDSLPAKGTTTTGTPGWSSMGEATFGSAAASGAAQGFQGFSTQTAPGPILSPNLGTAQGSPPQPPAGSIWRKARSSNPLN